MKKLICTIIISFICILWFSFSDDANTYDCLKATLNENWEYLNIPLNQYTGILPNEAMTKVFENLRFACCSTWILTGNDCENYDKDAIFPNSMYLFDHLLDIYLRRLDAKQADSNWWDLIYGLAPDPVWKEWREFMSEIANDSDGTAPTIINEKYRNFWKWSIFLESYTYAENQTNYNLWLENVKKKTINYPERSLFDRYNNACNVVLMMYMYIVKPIDNSWLWYKETSAKQAKLLDIYNSCTELVSSRVNAERLYTEAIMQQKWSVFLDDTLDAYLNTYFLENKLSNLHDKIFNRETMFQEIVKSVSKLVRHCS